MTSVKTRSKQWVLIGGLIAMLVNGPALSAAESGEEVAFGNYRDRQEVTKRLLVLDEPLNRKVTALGNRLATAAGRPDLTYTFRIVNDPGIQARATSGGFVYIHTGLLEVCESADELAAVVAHEVAHISESHLVNHIHSAHRKQLAWKAGGLIVGAIIGAQMGGLVPKPAPFTTLITSPQEIMHQTMQLGGLFGDAISEVSIRGYKKELEIQADELAVDYLARAGYDPYALIRLFKRLKTIGDSAAVPEEFHASTLINKKPGLDERITHMQAVLQAKGLPNPQ